MMKSKRTLFPLRYDRGTQKVLPKCDIRHNAKK